MTNQNSPTQGNEEVARKQTDWLMNPVEVKHGESPTPEADAHMVRADAMRAIVKQLLDAKDLAHKEEVEKMKRIQDTFAEQNEIDREHNRQLQGEVAVLKSSSNLYQMLEDARVEMESLSKACDHERDRFKSRGVEIDTLQADLKMAVEALQEIADGTSLPVDDSNPACEMSETARAVLSKLSVKEKT